MIFASSNFGAGCIKDSRDQKLKKTSAYSISLRLCVKNLWDGSGPLLQMENCAERKSSKFNLVKLS